MKSPRQARIDEMKAQIRDGLATDLTPMRVADYEAMTDEQYDTHIAAARQRSINTMAASVYAGVKGRD